MIIHELIDTSNDDELRKPSRLFFCYLENAQHYKINSDINFSIYPRNTVDYQWIKLSERKPEKDGRYMVVVPYGSIPWIGVSSMRNGVFDDAKTEWWMPLPEAPEVKE